jgi:hypothetical protein
LKPITIILPITAIIILIVFQGIAHADVLPSIVINAPPQNNNAAMLSGTIYDNAGNKIPDANVTLWQGGSIVNVQNNPQLTQDNTNPGNLGLFAFMNVPLGTYILSADINGHSTVQTVTVQYGSTNYYLITIPDYTYQTPAPLVISSPTPSPAPSIAPAPTPSQYDQGESMGIMITLGILGVLIVGILIGFLLTRKK